MPILYGRLFAAWAAIGIDLMGVFLPHFLYTSCKRMLVRHCHVIVLRAQRVDNSADTPNSTARRKILFKFWGLGDNIPPLRSGHRKLISCLVVHNVRTIPRAKIWMAPVKSGSCQKSHNVASKFKEERWMMLMCEADKTASNPQVNGSKPGAGKIKSLTRPSRSSTWVQIEGMLRVKHRLVVRYLLRQTVRPVKRFKNLLRDSQLGEFYAVHAAAKFDQRISIWRRGMHRKMRVDGGSHGKAPEKDERVLLTNRLR
ncbi:hypothetical protein B0H14DRAFT_3133471 [Mycena olivaceomarginata]|nr:hypothetical protein B0H14DRAFT_3133471 [Mycena olivaceomarginata]